MELSDIETKPMVIMMMSDVLGGMGGSERNLYLLARSLRDRGHTVIVCCFKGGDVSERMEQEGFLVEDLNIKRIYAPRGIKAILKLLKIARKQKVSAIISYHKDADYAGWLLSLVARIPIISSRRDTGFDLKRRHVWTYRIINPFFDGITAVSESVKTAVLRIQGAKSDNITVIYNGVDLTLDASEDRNADRVDVFDTDREYTKIVCIGNIRPIKGQIHFVDAVKLVVDQFPQARFYLVGRCVNEPYYREVLGRIQKHGLENLVKLTGPVQQSRMRDVWKAMDICVIPSLSEGMSNALLEAMVAAKPVIATAVGGNTEVVRNGETGYLIPSGDPVAMAKALNKLLLDPALRRALGLRARSWAEMNFSLDKMIEKYEDLLEFVCLKRKMGIGQSLRAKLNRVLNAAKQCCKVVAATACYYGGLVAILRWAKRAFRLGRPKILCFHDVSWWAEGRRCGISITPDYFSSIVNFLAREYRVVSLEEAVRLLETGQSLTDDVFALTFDDCYIGWMKHVLPECQRRQLPFAIFAATQPLDLHRPLLYDSLIFLAEKTWRRVADLSHLGLGMFLLDTGPNIRSFVERLQECWEARNKKETNQFLQEAGKYLGVDLNSEDLRKTMLCWDDLRAMAGQGVTVGAHTVSHPLLTALKPHECSEEIVQSTKRLGEEIGQRVIFFAYPYGHPKSYNHSVIKTVEDAGFSNAFVLDNGAGRRFRRFEINRHDVSKEEFVGFGGKFCKSLAAVELSGIGDFLFGRIFVRKKRRD